MLLSQLQLECQRLGADMTLSFGCMIAKKEETGETLRYRGNFYFMGKEVTEGSIMHERCLETIEIIGHPLTRGRLCYLRQTNKRKKPVADGIKTKLEKRMQVHFRFEENPELYNQTILERDEETINLVYKFLLSIQ